MMTSVNQLIRNLRGDLSLREASGRVGISHTYLDTIEKGCDKRTGKEISPSPDTLKKLADAYHYPYKDLLVRAGYLHDEGVDELEIKNIKDAIRGKGFKNLNILDHNKWKHLTREDIEYFDKIFEAIYQLNTK